MSWRTVKLGDVFEIARGGSPRPIEEFVTDDPEGLNWVSISDATRSGKVIERTERRIRKEGLTKSRWVEPGDFLLSNSMSFGRPYIMGTTGCIHDGWLVLKPGKTTVDPDYLYHLLGSPEVFSQFAKRATGTTVKNLNTEIVSDTQVPLPPLPEQRRIAAILDQADALRRLRRDSLDRLGDLGQAIFYEMFGDVIANDRQLPVATLDEYISGFDTGKNLASDPDNDGATNRVLKISAVTSGRFDPREAKPLPNTYRPPASHFVKNGDLLFSRANTAALIGATAIVDHASDNLVLPDKLWRFQWHGRTEAVFTHHLFQSPPMRAEISRRASGTSGSMKNIGKGKVLSIRLGLPGPEQRQEFERRINRGQDVMNAARQALTQADKLFASLQHRAFRGEL